MLKKYKHFLIGFLVGALLFSLSPVFANSELNIIKNPFPILVNGQVTEVEGYNINGYTYLKLTDFGKAGLDVKFNETEKRIEIESVIKSPDKRGDDNRVEESRTIESATIEKDGYNLIVVNGIEYVNIEEVYKKYEGKYRFNPLDGSKPIRRAAIVVIDNITDEHITAIPNQYTIKTNEKTYLDYGYFLEVVLPEITAKKTTMEVIKKDGYNLMVVNGIEYVSVEEVYKRYEGKCSFSPLEKSLAMGITLRDNATGQLLLIIRRSQITKFNNRGYVTLKYFTDTVLPLIDKEGN